MLSYEKDIKPVRITAFDAYNHTCGGDEYYKKLIAIYKGIKNEIENGNTYIEHYFDQIDYQQAEEIYRELTMQGYNTRLTKDGDYIVLSADWSFTKFSRPNFISWGL